MPESGYVYLRGSWHLTLVGDEEVHGAAAATAPLAIVLAVLRTVGVEVELALPEEP